MKLNKKHLDLLQRTPFWNLFKSFIDKSYDYSKTKKNDDDVLSIIQSFDHQSDSFNIGGKRIKVTIDEVDLIFGIQSGKKKVEVSLGGKPETSFVQRRFQNVKRPNAPKVKEQLLKAFKGKTNTDYEDFTKLCCLYLFVCLFYTNSGQTLGWNFFNYVDDISKIKDYAWSTSILETLMQSIKKHPSTPLSVAGCVLLLPYWLCEHTRIIQPSHASKFPRLLKWDLRELHKAMAKTKIKKIKKDQVIIEELSYSLNELKQLGNRTPSRAQSETEDDEDDDETHTESLQDNEEETDEENERGSGNQSPGDDEDHESMLVELQKRMAEMEAENVKLLQKDKEMEKQTIEWREGCQKLTSELDKKTDYIQNLEDRVKLLIEKDKLKDSEIEAEKEAARMYLKKIDEQHKQIEEFQLDATVHNITQQVSLEKDNEFLQAELKERDEMIAALQKLKGSSTESPLQIVPLQIWSPMHGPVDTIQCQTIAGQNNNNQSMISNIKAEQRKSTKNPEFKYTFDSTNKARGRKRKNSGRGNKQQAKPKKFRYSFPKTAVVKLMDIQDLEKLKHIVTLTEGSGAIWEGNFGVVHYEDMRAISEEDEVPSNVIDAYTEILYAEQGDKSVDVGSSYFVSANISQSLLNQSQEHLFDALVNKKVDLNFHRYIHFPLHNHGHWTLAVYDVSENVWRHYNSLLPNVEAEDNSHLQLVSKLRDEFEKHFSVNKGGKIISMADAPQQEQMSMDCGPVILHIMKQYAAKEEVTTHTMDRKKCRPIRAHIMHKFLNDKHHTYTDEDHMVRQMYMTP